MRYSTVTFLGLVIFTVALTLSVFAYVLNWTTLFGSMPETQLSFGPFTLFRLETFAGGGRLAYAWGGLLPLAIVGQVAMLGGMFLRPQKLNLA